MLAKERRRTAAVFQALGDPTRLALVARLAHGEPQPMARLTKGTRMTRQAVAKHLGVLRKAGIVRSARCGRETRFALAPEAIGEAQGCLAKLSMQWEDALGRLQAMVEE